MTRRAAPHLASLFAVLLLTVWAGSAGACLAAMRFDPARTLCHTADAAPSDPAAPDHQASTACPLCAPLPPVLVGAGPALPAPRTSDVAVIPAATVLRPAPAPHATPQQPRAPPSFS